jgi:hypothetical protein
MLKRGGDVQQSIEGIEQITPEMWAAHDARIKATKQTGRSTRPETFIGPPVDSSSQDKSSWGEIAGTMASDPLNASILGMAVKGFRLAKKAAAAKVGKKADKLATAKRKDGFSQMLAQYEGAAEREASLTSRSSGSAPSPKELRRRTDEILFGSNYGPSPPPLAPPPGGYPPWKPLGPRDVSTLPPKTVTDAPAPRRPIWPSNEYRPPPPPPTTEPRTSSNNGPWAKPYVNPPYEPIISSRLRPYVERAAAEPEPSPGSAAQSVNDHYAKNTKTAEPTPAPARESGTTGTQTGESESVYKSGAHDSMFVQDDNVVNKISNISQYLKETGGLTPAQLDAMTDAGFRVIADDAVKWGAAKGNPVPKKLKYATASVNGSTYAKIKRELHPDVYDTASLNKHIPTSRMKGGKK